MKKRNGRNYTNHLITRRHFIETVSVGSAALLTVGLTPSPGASAVAATGDFQFVEATIPELQTAMSTGQLSARDLVLGFLSRIQQLNPLLHAVIETNPDAVAIAAGLDNDRRAGKIRGPLHGIPILVKDTIATLDKMQTTAGSLALYGSRVASDAMVIQRLRSAGAIILGKANLAEWGNFRGFNFAYPLALGWSARGGNTNNSYDLSYTSWGSSSGSAAATAANLCAAAIGQETDGSITGPSAVENIVGLKPTVGLISRNGIVPTDRQDTAGPMARSVTDVAILLGCMQCPYGEVLGYSPPTDYTPFLRRGALNGKRIGRDARYFDYAYYGSGIPGDEESVAFAEYALQVMQSLGATIVDTDTGDVLEYTNDELTALLFEGKNAINEYLPTLRQTEMRTLSDLIAFNNSHCSQELVYYGQEIFELADATSGNLSDPLYVGARTHATNTARAGIDGAMIRDHLDAIVAPHLTNSTGPAVAGYPNLSLPIGIRSSGRPVGMFIYSTFLREAQLLAMAYDLEQALQARQKPQFLYAATPVPNAGLCGLPHPPQGKAHLPHGRIF
jgi:amidase